MGKNTAGFRPILTGAAISAAVLGSLFIAIIATAPGYRCNVVPMTGTTAPAELRRYGSPPPRAEEVNGAGKQADSRPEKSRSSEDTAAISSLNEPAARDEHFKAVLESLASRRRQEAFEQIFDGNLWGCDSHFRARSLSSTRSLVRMSMSRDMLAHLVAPVSKRNITSRNEESRSGGGSSEEYTRNTRTLLAHTLKEFGIKDWIDAPCGDCNWQGLIKGIDDVAYLGLDIVPGLIAGNQEKYAKRPNMRFKQQDFINEPFPHQPDLILNRDMIQHNSLEDGVRAYYNIEKSGAKYLATTWHQQGENNIMHHNGNTPSGGMYYVNIFLHPFNFSKPDFFIREGGDQADQKTLGLWRLPAMGLGDGQYFDIPQEAWLKAEKELVHVKDMPRKK